MPNRPFNPLITLRLDTHREGWFEGFCPFCDWETSGYEPNVEDWLHEHAEKIHPRRYRRSMNIWS